MRRFSPSPLPRAQPGFRLCYGRRGDFPYSFVLCSFCFLLCALLVPGSLFLVLGSWFLVLLLALPRLINNPMHSVDPRLWKLLRIGQRACDAGHSLPNAG